MSSPWRISWRARRFLEQRGEVFGAADGGHAVGGGSHGGLVPSVDVQAAGCENPVSRAAGWLSNSVREAPAKAPADGLLHCVRPVRLPALPIVNVRSVRYASPARVAAR